MWQIVAFVRHRRGGKRSLARVSSTAVLETVGHEDGETHTLLPPPAGGGGGGGTPPVYPKAWQYWSVITTIKDFFWGGGGGERGVSYSHTFQTAQTVHAAFIV